MPDSPPPTSDTISIEEMLAAQEKEDEEMAELAKLLAAKQESKLAREKQLIKKVEEHDRKALEALNKLTGGLWKVYETRRKKLVEERNKLTNVINVPLPDHLKFNGLSPTEPESHQWCLYTLDTPSGISAPLAPQVPLARPAASRQNTSLSTTPLIPSLPSSRTSRLSPPFHNGASSSLPLPNYSTDIKPSFATGFHPPPIPRTDSIAFSASSPAATSGLFDSLKKRTHKTARYLAAPAASRSNDSDQRQSSSQRKLDGRKEVWSAALTKMGKGLKTEIYFCPTTTFEDKTESNVVQALERTKLRVYPLILNGMTPEQVCETVFESLSKLCNSSDPKITIKCRPEELSWGYCVTPKSFNIIPIAGQGIEATFLNSLTPTELKSAYGTKRIFITLPSPNVVSDHLLPVLENIINPLPPPSTGTKASSQGRAKKGARGKGKGKIVKRKSRPWERNSVSEDEDEIEESEEDSEMEVIGEQNNNSDSDVIIQSPDLVPLPEFQGRGSPLFNEDFLSPTAAEDVEMAGVSNPLVLSTPEKAAVEDSPAAPVASDPPNEDGSVSQTRDREDQRKLREALKDDNLQKIDKEDSVGLYCPDPIRDGGEGRPCELCGVKGPNRRSPYLKRLIVERLAVKGEDLQLEMVTSGKFKGRHMNSKNPTSHAVWQKNLPVCKRHQAEVTHNSRLLPTGDEIVWAEIIPFIESWFSDTDYVKKLVSYTGSPYYDAAVKALAGLPPNRQTEFLSGSFSEGVELLLPFLPGYLGEAGRDLFHALLKKHKIKPNRDLPDKFSTEAYQLLVAVPELGITALQTLRKEGQFGIEGRPPFTREEALELAASSTEHGRIYSMDMGEKQFRFLMNSIEFVPQK